MATRQAHGDERSSFKHWAPKLGIEGGTHYQRIDLLTAFIAANILPHTAFYFDLKDHEGPAIGHPQNSIVFDRCRSEHQRLTQTEEKTVYSTMSRLDLYALAVTRVHACLIWAGDVVDEFDGGEVLYPRFCTTDEDEQLDISIGILRLIQSHRKGRNTFSPNREEDWPYHRMQKCIGAWKRQSNAVDFSNLDMTVATPRKEWRSSQRRTSSAS